MAEIYESSTAGLPRPDAATLVARAAEQDWQNSGSDGFLIKPLYEDVDSGQRTWLMKVAPGADAPMHDHQQLEQIYVIEGEFSDQDNTYRAGDFAVRAPGFLHTASSKTGALVLLFYAP